MGRVRIRELGGWYYLYNKEIATLSLPQMKERGFIAKNLPQAIQAKQRMLKQDREKNNGRGI